jgi:hypothetical protein
MSNWRQTLQVKSWQIPTLPPDPLGASDVLAYRVATAGMTVLWDTVQNYNIDQEVHLKNINSIEFTNKLKSYLTDMVNHIKVEDIFAEEDRDVS